MAFILKLHSHRVLIVEDEFIIAAALEDIVREAGGKVIGSAISATGALRIIDSEELTAAILDVQLGNHDSFPVAQRLVEDGIPFVFHTGNANTEAISVNWPQAVILAKPTTAEALLSAIEAMPST